MADNILIKDGNNVNRTLHTIEDSTSAHFNQSIPTDSAGNTAVVVSGGQAVAGTMGALVVTQRDALPAGTNLIGGVSVRGISDVSVSPNGLNIPVSLAPPTFNVPVSIAVVSLGGGTATIGKIGGGYLDTILAVSIGGGSSLIGRVSVAGLVSVWPANTIVPDTDAKVLQGFNHEIHTAAGYVYNRASNTWDRMTGTSVGLAITGSVSINDRVSIAATGVVADNTGSGQVLYVGAQGLVRNRNSNTWDMMTGTSLGLNVIANNVSLGGSAALIGSVSISPNGLNIPVSIAPPAYNLPVSVHPVTQSGTWNIGAITSINSRVAVSVENLNNIAVSIAPPTFNVPVSIAGTPTVGLAAGTNLIGAVSVRGSIIGAVSIANIADVSISPNGLNIPVSIAAGRVSVNGIVTVSPATNFSAALPAGGFAVGGEVSTANGNFSSGVLAPLQLDANGRLKIAGTITGGSMTQTVAAAVTTEGYPMLGSDGANARRLLTTTGGALIVHVSNAQPTPTGISMTQTVGAAVTTEGYPMLGSDGTNARRLLTTTGGALVVHVSNSQAAAGATQLVSVGGAVSTQGLQVVGTDGVGDARTFLTDTGGRQVISSVAHIVGVSISPNGLNIPVSIAPPAYNLPVSVHPVTQSGTWNIGAITSINSRVAVSVENTNNIAVSIGAGANLIGAVSISPNGLNIPVSIGGGVAIGQATDGQANQNGLFVHNQGAVYNPISATWDRQAGTSLGTYIQANSSTGVAFLGRMLPVGGSDGTNNRVFKTHTDGALVVHVSNTAPGATGAGSMTQTVGAAVTTEGYPMLGSDGTNARRLLTTTGGAVIVHVSNALPATATSIAGIVTVAPAANFSAALPAGGFAVGGEVSTANGTFSSGVLAPLQLDANGRLKISGTITGGSMTQTVAAAVTTEGYPMLGSDGTNARRLLTTTGGALIVHVSNSAPGGGGGSPQVSIAGPVSNQATQVAGMDTAGNARTLKTNVSGVQIITTRTFMSQYTFTRPNDTTAYAAGATAAPGNAGDLIANNTVAGSVIPLKFRVSKGPGQVSYIRGARMYRTGGTAAAGQHNIAGAIRLHLFNTNNKVSVANGDNGAFNASPVSNWMGYIDLVAIACAPGLRTSGAVSTQVYWGSPARTGEMIVDLSAAQVSIQGLLETRIAFTPIAQEIFTVQIEGFNG